MSTGLVVLVIASALGAGVVAGVFFAFSTFVMPALGRIPAPAGIAAMQSINVTVINAWFMAAFMGTAVTSVAAIALAVADWQSAFGPYVVAAGVLYVVGVIGVTRAFHIPRNDALDKLDPAAPTSEAFWSRYLVEWNAWNHVRAIAPLIASGLEIGALHVGF